MRGAGPGGTVRLCRRNAQRDGVSITGLLGRYGFWSRFHLSIPWHPLSASRGGSCLRDAIGLAGEIPGGPLAATDRRRELHRRAITERSRPDAGAFGGVAPGADGALRRGHRDAENIRGAWLRRVGAQACQ